jgi:hypothetical protein
MRFRRLSCLPLRFLSKTAACGSGRAGERLRRTRAVAVSRYADVQLANLFGPLPIRRGRREAKYDSDEEEVKVEEKGQHQQAEAHIGEQPVVAPNLDLCHVGESVHRRVIDLVTSGRLSRAARRLRSDITVKDSTNPAVQAKVQALYPRRPGNALPPLPCNAPRVNIEAATVRMVVLKRMQFGKAAGPSGWTREMIVPLLEDPACVEGLTCLVELICNGEVKGEASKALRAVTSVPSGKKGNAEGVRPLGVGEAFDKMADYAVMSSVQGIVFDKQEPFAPLQLGVGFSGGCEAMAFTVQEALRSPDGCGVLMVDVENAYNTLERGVILSRLFGCPKAAQMWRKAAWTLGEPPGVVYLRDSAGRVVKEIFAEQGVSQGAALSPFLFALTTLPALRKVDAFPGVTARAILDDTALMAKPHELLNAYSVFVQALGDCGLRVKQGKSRLLWGLGELPPDVLAFCQAHQIRAVISGVEAVVGVPIAIGGEADSSRACLAKVMEESSGLMTAVKELPCRVANLLLRMCALPIPVYLTRATGLDSMRVAAGWFDGEMARTLREVFGITEAEWGLAKESFLNPIADGGGMGFRPTSRILDVAALASRASALYTIKQAKFALAGQLEDEVETLVKRVRTAIGTDRPDGNPKVVEAATLLPTPGQSALSFYCRPPQAQGRADPKPTKMQAAFTDALESKTMQEQATRHIGTPTVANRIEAGRHPAASSLLRHIDGMGERLVTGRDNDVFRTYVRLRTGLPPADHERAKNLWCSVCPHASFAQDPWHALSCAKLRCGPIRERHDQGVHAISRWVSRLGGVVTEEIGYLGVGDRKRPDHKLLLGDLECITDFQVRHTVAPSHGSSRSAKKVLEEAERVKERKYASMAQEHGLKFFPLIASTFGSFAPKLDNFLQKVASAAAVEPMCVLTGGQIKQKMALSVANAIAAGNQAALRVSARYRSTAPAVRPRLGRFHSQDPPDPPDPGPRREAKESEQKQQPLGNGERETRGLLPAAGDGPLNQHLFSQLAHNDQAEVKGEGIVFQLQEAEVVAMGARLRQVSLNLQPAPHGAGGGDAARGNGAVAWMTTEVQREHQLQPAERVRRVQDAVRVLQGIRAPSPRELAGDPREAVRLLQGCRSVSPHSSSEQSPSASAMSSPSAGGVAEGVMFGMGRGDGVGMGYVSASRGEEHPSFSLTGEVVVQSAPRRSPLPHDAVSGGDVLSRLGVRSGDDGVDMSMFRVPSPPLADGDVM